MYYYTIISMTRKNNLFLYYIMAKTRKAGGTWKKAGGTWKKAGGKWKKGGGKWKKGGGTRRMRTRRHRLSGGINTPPRRQTPSEFLRANVRMLKAAAPAERPAEFLKANVPMLPVQKLKRRKAFKRKNTPKSLPKSSPKSKSSDNYTDVYGYVPGVSVPAIPPKKFTQSEMPRDLYQNFSPEYKKKYKQINKDHFRNLGMEVSDSSSDSSSDTSV
jgi:hypothetical protein